MKGGTSGFRLQCVFCGAIAIAVTRYKSGFEVGFVLPQLKKSSSSKRLEENIPEPFSVLC